MQSESIDKLALNIQFRPLDCYKVYGIMQWIVSCCLVVFLAAVCKLSLF